MKKYKTFGVGVLLITINVLFQLYYSKSIIQDFKKFKTQYIKYKAQANSLASIKADECK